MGTLGPAKGSRGSRASIDSAVRDGSPPESRNLKRKSFSQVKGPISAKTATFLPLLPEVHGRFPLVFGGRGRLMGFTEPANQSSGVPGSRRGHTVRIWFQNRVFSFSPHVLP